MMSRKRPLPAWMTLASQVPSHTLSEPQKGQEANGTSKSKKKWKEDNLTKASTEFDKILQNNLPEILFSGRLVYSHHKSDCSALCEDVELTLCAIDDAFIGFDMEWPVTYEVGKEQRTALIQICTSPDTCYIFHLSCIGSLPKALQSLIQNPEIKKVGIGIESDLWKLERDFGIPVHNVIKSSMVDLGKLANDVLKTKETWSLEGLVRHLFHSRINKDAEVRKGDWTTYPLSEQQKSYAATDAYASYIVYDKLRFMKK